MIQLELETHLTVSVLYYKKEEIFMYITLTLNINISLDRAYPETMQTNKNITGNEYSNIRCTKFKQKIGKRKRWPE